MREPTGGSSRPKRPVVVPALGLVAVTALGITALLGGLDERPDPAPEQLKTGQPLDQGEFETEFVEAKTTLEPAKNQFGKDRRYVDVVVKVTNKTDQTIFVGGPISDRGYGSGFGGTVLRTTPQINSKVKPEFFAMTAGTRSSQLHPDLPTTVIARYELEEGAQPPAQVALELGRYEDLENRLTGVHTWLLETKYGYLDKAFQNKVVARITLPVKPEGV
ncbi:hypothetical protein [Nonomuraea rhizosphaerae]|uniref:hypothetical protein n=1 Tax=Nonomuraea rhizosphaerae TaxID=2665663 RepID=UPI001C5E10B2|nr:hypothetical protein [Nonomuraea rhizosphaerae]